MQKTKTISFVLVLVLLFSILLTAILMCNFTNAQAETEQEEKSLAELFSKTNTYNCKVAEVTNIEEKDVYNVQYDLSASGKNSNQVMDIPQITVLTPGLSSKASVWSNQYDGIKELKFEYDEDSLIEKLIDKSDSSMFRVFVNENNEVDIFPDYSLNDMDKISSITDISKHIIIIFDPNNADASNDGIYYEFNIAIGNIVLQVKELNGGILPKLNLIGHSRGGLTNMQYALDHPDMVASLISIGTPYFSSNTANVLGEMFMGGQTDGLDDIVDPNIYMQYYNRWNDNYDNLYKEINAVAIGGYSSLSMLPLILTNDKSNVIESVAGLNKSERVAVAVFLEGFFAYVAGVKGLNIELSSINSLLTRGLNALLPQSKIVDILTLINSEIGLTYHPPFTAYFGDLLVPLDSQLGIENGIELLNIHRYKGFKRYKRYFNEFNTNFDKVAQAMPPAVHNLEPRDAQIIEWVCNEVNMGIVEEGFRYKKVNESGIAITGYYGRYDSTEVVVPAQIDGFDVVAIYDNAFNESWFRENMTKVTLPSSVISIGESAFADCSALKNVELGENCLLESIGKGAFGGCVSLDHLPDLGAVQQIADGAFAGSSIKKIDFAQFPSINSIGAGAFRECKNLASLTFGSNITSIGEYAFFGCEDLTSVAIPQGIAEIGVGAFAGCLAMTHINVDSANNVYKSISGVLYSKDESVIYQYPAGQAGYMYVVPDSVRTIAECAFAFNSMRDIRLNKDLKQIGKYAFYSNKSLTEIVVYKEISNIDLYAFADCTSLRKVTLFNPNPNHLSDWAFDNIADDAKFFVTYYALSKDYDVNKFNKLEYFIDRFALKDYVKNLNPIKYNAHYYDGDKLIVTRTQYYLTKDLAYAEKEGYVLSCWHYKGTKNLFNSSDYVLDEEIELQAQWITKQFKIKFTRINSSGGVEFGYLSIVNGVGDIVMQPTMVKYGAKANEKIKEKLMDWYYNEGRYYEGKVLEKFEFSKVCVAGPSINLGGYGQGATQGYNKILIGESFKPEDNYDYSAVYAFVESLIEEGVRDFGDADEIWIDPQFRTKKVTFNFNPNGGEFDGDRRVSKDFGMSFSMAVPEMWGYSFLGWNIESILAVSDKYDTSKLPNFTSSNNSYIGKIYNFATVPDLIYKIPFDYSVNLVAQWKYETIDAYAMSGSEINGGNTKWIDFSRYQGLTNVYKTFKVANTVSKLYVKNMALLENVNFKILGDCTLIFENCLFKAPNGECGVDATGKNLKLVGLGQNIILGGDKVDFLKSAMSTYCAGIIANSLTIEGPCNENDYLIITGGNGYNSQSAGVDGSIGGVGIKVNDLIVVSGKVKVFGGKGGTGAKGADAASTSSGVGYVGGKGGNGGKGGVGLNVFSSCTVGNNVDFEIKGGDGGQGGEGGKGGKGADGKFANPAKQGGQGGAGGNGGDGGAAVEKRPIVNIDEDMISIYGGDGGMGGTGGQGGDGGKKYLTNNHAAQGASGQKGNRGSYGEYYI
ncbi:MAG: alpha/beta fold hydrolase [Clostridia bacterium]|nr:alpha/beta fold hydrolase [Clostridia bacterium]